jgi:phosphatidylserine/phosphatidylglycerophosphate/cardiolipin synthase-like enzyme
VTEPFHAAVAVLVAEESTEILCLFADAIMAGRLQTRATLARLQDELRVGNVRAQRFRTVLREAGARPTSQIADSVLAAAAGVQEARLRSPTVAVALTHPGPIVPAIRTTGAVTRELITEAQRTLLVVGYSVTVDAQLAGLAAQTVAEMSRAAARGVQVTAVLHRDEKNARALRRAWPRNRDPPRIFTWPERADDEMASLHAKLLVADASDALVTSANLTYHGLEANIEVGVRVTGSAARQLESIFLELIRTKDFIPWPESA